MGLESSRSAADIPDMVRVTAVSAFSDNYIWVVHGLVPGPDGARRVAVVDPGDAEPVFAALATHGLVLDTILATHHHRDHVGGVLALLERFPVPVYGPARERIPGRSVALEQGATVDLPGLGLGFSVLDVPGHTAGHIAYFGHNMLFCGDTLFSAGCGRLFEGTAAQMLASLERLASLPAATRVYCGHEYTAANLRFALAVEPDNTAVRDHLALVSALRARAEPTVPSTLGLEVRINPFLRTRLPTVRAAASAHAGRPLADDADAFGVVRHWKNEFRA
jgi:hydroxyacylglutathione hydrolase